MRKALLIFLSILLMLCGTFFSSCRKDVKDPSEIIDELKDLKSYSCDVCIDVKNDRQKLTYTGKQYYLKDFGSRLELEKGRAFLFKKDNIYVRDLLNGSRYITKQGFDDIFKLSFIEKYIGLLYTNEVIKYSYKVCDNKSNLLIELMIPGNNRNISKAILYVDENSNLPKKIIIYDIKGNEKVQITYDNFKTDTEVDTKLFDINDFVGE